MLYVSTRNKNDAYTAARTLNLDRAPDGGLFVPFRLPYYAEGDLISLKDKNFGQIIAHFLNQFFSTQLSGWDVDFAVGRKLVKLVQVGSKTTVAELWHNSEARYGYILENLYHKVCGSAAKQPTEWFAIAIRIAVIFGLYGEMLSSGLASFGQLIDVSVPAEDFTAAIAAVYARRMGLPIGSVVCCCGEDSTVGEFLRRGVISCRGAAAVPDGLERLIHTTLTHEMIDCLMQAQDSSRVFTLDADELQCMNDGLFASAVGVQRVNSVIASMFRTSKYVMDPDTALTFAGLQDFRAITGESRPALLLMENAPMAAQQQICRTIGISAEELAGQL